MATHEAPTPAGALRGVRVQPVVLLALHVAVSIIETDPGVLRKSPVATYTVWLASSTARPVGELPTATVATCPHPAVTVALQVAALKTDTELFPTLTT